MIKYDMFLKRITQYNDNAGIINFDNRLYEFYNRALTDLDSLNLKPFTINEVNNFISNSSLLNDFLVSMDSFDTSILYKSDIHGYYHNVRVSLYAFIITTLENISKSDFKIVMDATKYHDIGRSNDFEDKGHGKISSEKISFLKDNYSQEEFNILKSIIECHSLNDNMIEEIAIKNGVFDIERCKKLLNILKDSDGLDRVRLEYPYINIKFLRTLSAKKLVGYSFKIYNNFEKFVEVNNE